MTGPRVLPQYYGGNVGQAITQALYQKQALDRQRDLDAVTSGIGMKPISDYDATHPVDQPSGLSRFASAIRSKITGQPADASTAQIDHTRGALNDLASTNASANGQAVAQGMATGQTATPDQNTYGGTARGATVPGAFNPAAGGFNPAMPRYAQLPSGQTVDLAFTPFGQRMQQAQLMHEYNAALQGMKGQQKMEQIGAQGQNQVNTANIRGGYALQTTGMRDQTAMRNTDATNATRVQTTGMNNATSAANNANTVNAGLTKHNTVSADAMAHVAASAGMNQTVMQSRSHLPEATQADAALDQLGATLSQHGGNGVLSNIGLGKLSPDMQRANQAGEQFVTLVGPMLNHGRMTAQDIDQVRKTYVPQYGDTPQVIAQKSAARKQALQAIHQQARLGTMPGVAAPASNAGGGDPFGDIPMAKH